MRDSKMRPLRTGFRPDTSIPTVDNDGAGIMWRGIIFSLFVAMSTVYLFSTVPTWGWRGGAPYVAGVFVGLAGRSFILVRW